MFTNNSELGRITSYKKVYRKPVYQKSVYKYSDIKSATRIKPHYKYSLPKKRLGYGKHRLSDHELMYIYDTGQMLGLGEYELGKLKFKKIFKSVAKVVKKIAPFTFAPITGGTSLLFTKPGRRYVKGITKGISKITKIGKKPKSIENVAPSPPSIDTSMVQAPMQHTQEIQNPSLIQSSNREAAAELVPTQQDIGTETEEQPIQAGLLGKVNTPVIIGLTTIVALVGYSLLSSPKKGKK